MFRLEYVIIRHLLLLAASIKKSLKIKQLSKMFEVLLNSFNDNLNQEAQQHYHQLTSADRRKSNSNCLNTPGKELQMNSCKEIWRKCDAVCFDVDSTVCCDEAIDELAKFLGKSKEVSDITKSAMLGGANFRDALAKRLDIIRPSQNMIAQFIAKHPPRLTEHIEELIYKLHQLGKDVYLVSGGFDVIIQPVAERLNIPVENIYANSIKFYYDGTYAGFDKTRPTSNQDGKSRVVSLLKQTKGYRTVVMIGDGVTDLEACPPADAFIGFGGNQVRETVRDNSNWFVYSFKELITELPYCNRKIVKSINNN